MTNTKVTPMTGVTSNGKKQLIENLNRMVLPEMLLNRLNRDILQHRNELQTALDSLLSGQEFLKLLRQRTDNLKTNNDLFPDDEHTMLKEVDNEINIISNTLSSSYNSLDLLISDVLTSALLIGYHTGAHDMRINLEKHAENGFQKSVLDPQKGGNIKAGKVEPLKNLINEMACFLYTNNCIGKFTKENATASIFQLLYEFNINNKSLECFSTFTNNEIKERFVNQQIKHKQKSSSLRQPSVSKLVEVLKAEYNQTKIKKKLK